VVNFTRITNHQLQSGGYGGELRLDYKSSNFRVVGVVVNFTRITNHQLWVVLCRLVSSGELWSVTNHELQGGGCSACAPANISYSPPQEKIEKDTVK
jgi:hypothetical protein